MKQYIKISDYETIQLDDEWIIMNTDNFTVTKLNDLGGLCWTLLDQPQTLQSLSQSLKNVYNIKNESLHQDIEAFLSELIKYGLVQHAV
ncbi:PqqD family protein [Metabacillus sp. Hm71]|uniref:PqqD family protein n=1 Tax=Metabacillus sp. Hm71 TaxID=3450743 RepID=UPI003F4334FF